MSALSRRLFLAKHSGGTVCIWMNVMNLHSCFVLSFLILEGEMFVVLLWVLLCCRCYTSMEDTLSFVMKWSFSSFCFHFLGALG